MLVECELDFHGQDVCVLSDFLAQSFERHESGGVFFCCNDDFALVHLGECLVDGVHVFGGEQVVVAERERVDVAASGLQVEHHLLGRCDAGEKQNFVFFVQRVEWQLCASEQRTKVAVVQSGEKESLIRVEIHGFGEYTVFHGFQVLRAFGNYHEVCPRLSFLGLTQSACRQQLVVYDEMVVVNE